MVRMASRARLLIPLAVASLAALLGCANEAGVPRPTARPNIRVLPAPTQNVGATATAYAQRIIPTRTPAGQYTVKSGDTLSKIADAFATTVDEIMAVNNLGDPNMIEVGQQLIIPPQIMATDTPAEPALEQTGTPPNVDAVPVPSLVSP